MAGTAERPVDIHIDLDEIAPTLIGMMGDGGYAEWSQSLRDELARFLTESIRMPGGYTLESTPLRGATSKGAMLAISALTILLSAGAGYAYDAKKTRAVINGVWDILRKVLPPTVKIHVKTAYYDGTIEAPNATDARRLLQESMIVLREHPPAMKRTRQKRDRDVAFKPQAR